MVWAVVAVAARGARLVSWSAMTAACSVRVSRLWAMLMRARV